MPLLPAVDAHHHLWDLKANSYPWLTPGDAPSPFPGFEKLCRDYLVSDFRADGARQAIVKSVHVQAEHDEADPVRETAWLQSVADAPASGGFPHAIVAFADLSESGVERILEGHRAFANTRGIRQMLNFDPRPGPRDADRSTSRRTCWRTRPSSRSSDCFVDTISPSMRSSFHGRRRTR